MSNSDSLQTHLKTFTEIFEALAVVGSPLEDEDKVITMLASLPDKFSTVVTALETLENVPSCMAVCNWKATAWRIKVKCKWSRK